MADENKAKTSQPQGKGGKFIAWVKALPRRIATPFKNMWTELKRVTWPTKRKLLIYSGMVLIFMLFMGVVIGLMDLGATKLVQAVGHKGAGIGSGSTTVVSTVTDAVVTEAVPEVVDTATVTDAQ